MPTFTPLPEAPNPNTMTEAEFNDASIAFVAAIVAFQNELNGATLNLKERCAVATTANITLSGTQTIDGVAVVAGERVLVKNQTTASQNGIYVVASGAWSRVVDMSVWNDVPAAVSVVMKGSTQADTMWICTADPGGTINTTSIAFVQVPTSLSGSVPKLTTPRLINGVSFDGSTNINIEDRLGTAIASAATTTVGNAGLGDYIHITGTMTITSFGTASASGIRRTLIFDGALTLTHNATSLICPGAANIVTVAGTIIEIVSETTTNWRVVSITHPSLSFAELSYLDGVTSAIQTQLNAKLGTGGGTLTGALVLAGDPSADLHPATRRWVQGRPSKDSARVATTGALTVTATSTTLTNSGTLAALIIDGITLIAGERVLVKNQTTASQNGIYEVTNVGSGSVAWVLTRSAGGDVWDDIVSAIISVDDGSINVNRTYFCTANPGGTIGTTDQAWEVIAEPMTGTRQSLTSSGYQRLAGGLIMQWQFFTTTVAGANPITFPIPFPNACLNCQTTRQGTAAAFVGLYSAPTTTGVSVIAHNTAGSAVTGVPMMILSIGC